MIALDVLGLLAFVLAVLVALVGWRRASAEHGDQLPLWRAVVGPLAGVRRPATDAALERLERRLEYAGRRRQDRVERFVEERAGALMLGLIIGIGWALMVGGLGGFLFFIVSLGGGWLVPDRMLDARARQRADIVARELPKAVDLMVTCLDAGLSLDQAITRVGEELRNSPLLAEELRITSGESQAGVPLADALRRLGRRVEHDDLASFTGVLAQAAALGTPIAQTLSEYAEASRRQRTAFLEERAGRMATRLTIPLTVCLLPAAILIIVGPAVIQLMKAVG